MNILQIPDEHVGFALQRFYNLLKSMYVYGTDKPAGGTVGTVLKIGDFVLELAHTAIIDIDGDDERVRVNITFLLGEDEFLFDYYSDYGV